MSRRVTVVTGASGGMGRAISRAFGSDTDLVLTDIDASGLERFSEALREEGFTIAASLAGDLGDDDFLAGLSRAQRTAGELGALIHTAGLSPVLADWKPILQLNLIATEKLLRAFEPSLVSGSTAVLIASMAGHIAERLPELDALLSDPLAEDFLNQVAPLLDQLCLDGDPYGRKTQAYFASKREVIRICERRAAHWGQRGARIVSISPGTIWTPMARREADGNAMALKVVESTPVGRWGTAMDIAAAARFLASSAASFITGCDLRVDGGVTPAMNGPMH